MSTAVATAAPAESVAPPAQEAQKPYKDSLGITKFAKGCVYYPLQWGAGVAALYALSLGAPTPLAVSRVMTVRAGGVTANTLFGDAIKNGIPTDLGIKFYKTPSEHLYSGDLLKYAFQRTAYAASVTMWPALIAIGLTLSMPYIAPAVLSLSSSLGTASLGLGSWASASSGVAATGYSALSGLTSVVGSVMADWPAAFAMKEGATLLGIASTAAKNIFMINLVAGTMGDVVGLEKLNPNHKHKATRGEAPAAPAR